MTGSVRPIDLGTLRIFVQDVYFIYINKTKLTETILAGNSDRNIPFAETCSLLRAMGFTERIRGSHHIFTLRTPFIRLNLQPQRSKVKEYQVKQIRNAFNDLGVRP